MGCTGRGHRACGRRAPGWSAFETFAAAAHVLTDAGLIVEANPAFERMYGGRRDDFYGRHEAELREGAGSGPRRLASRILKEAVTRGSWRGTLENRGRDGRRFTTRAHVYPMSVRGRLHYVCIQQEAEEALVPAGAEGGARQRLVRAAPG